MAAASPQQSTQQTSEEVSQALAGRLCLLPWRPFHFLPVAPGPLLSRPHLPFNGECSSSG